MKRMIISQCPLMILGFQYENVPSWAKIGVSIIDDILICLISMFQRISYV